MRKSRTQKGITLVSLITTVIVLCILAATAIGTIQKDGLISKSQGASAMYNNALKDDEAFMQEGESILDEVLGSVGGGGSSEGDSSNAAPEDVFLWKSDDPSSADYGTVIGYNKNVQNYPSLRFPDRCTKIAIEFPENIDGSIKSEMRSYTHNIKKIELPNTVTEIGAESFYSYEFRSLTTIIIPNSVTVIGKQAFDNCSSLTSITIPNSVTEIGVDAFADCYNLESITIGSGVKTIGANAFCNCESLISIIIPNGVTTIESYVFGRCVGLTTITIPDSVTTIGASAFSSCSSLTTITIPNSVTTVEDWAFGSCTGLTEITFNGTTEEWNQIELGTDWNYEVPAEEVTCTNGTVSLKALAAENVSDIINQVVPTNTTVYDEYGNKIVVPAGFKIRVDDSTNNATHVTEGIVIEHGTDENQFVWVPVGTIYTNTDKTVSKTITLGRYSSFKFNKYDVYAPAQTAENYATTTTIDSYYTEDTLSNHNLSYGNAIARDIGAFITSATTNGGYYLGRFEAGKSNGTLVCKYDQTVYNNITQPDASSVCQSMYTDGYSRGTFSSDLINSYAWDTAIIFIQTFGTSSKYSQTNGYSTTGSLAATGKNILSETQSVDKQLNIYDMAGNCFEWSTETYNNTNSPCISRGGESGGEGYANYPCLRNYNSRWIFCFIFVPPTYICSHIN